MVALRLRRRVQGSGTSKDSSSTLSPRRARAFFLSHSLAFYSGDLDGTAELGESDEGTCMVRRFGGSTKETATNWNVPVQVWVLWTEDELQKRPCNLPMHTKRRFVLLYLSILIELIVNVRTAGRVSNRCKTRPRVQ